MPIYLANGKQRVANYKLQNVKYKTAKVIQNPRIANSELQTAKSEFHKMHIMLH